MNPYQIDSHNASILDLAQTLRAPEVEARWAAAAGLAAAGAAALPALVEALQDPDPGVRQLAAEALGEVGSGARDADEALARALQDPDVAVRWAAAEALAKIGPEGPAVLSALASARRDPAWLVRQAALRALETLPRADRGASAYASLLRLATQVCWQ